MFFDSESQSSKCTSFKKTFHLSNYCGRLVYLSNKLEVVQYYYTQTDTFIHECFHCHVVTVPPDDISFA